ncbi:MAG TPA: hypothetical protein VGB77_12410, partial [Abditibacteriaceae bacterium]
MSLRNVMRKAAELLVEMPPEGADSSKSGESVTSSEAIVDAVDKVDTKPAPDIDELLAAVRGPKGQKDDEVSSSPSPP